MHKLGSYIRLFRMCFHYMGRARGKYIIGTILGSLELCIVFATPYINELVVNSVSNHNGKNVLRILLGMVLLFIVLVPLIAIGKYIQGVAVQNGNAKLREEIFAKIIELPYSISSSYKSGDHITRLTDDVFKSMGVFNSYASKSFIRFVIVFPISLILLFFSNFSLALVSILYSFITLFLSAYLNPYTKKLEEHSKLGIINSSNFLLQTMRGIPIIKVFTMQDRLINKYELICNKIRRERVKFRTANGFTYGIIDFFTFSAQPIGFILGILWSINDMELANAVFNATIMGIMGDSMLRLSTFLLLIQPNLVAMERVTNFLNGSQKKDSMLDSQCASQITESGVIVELENVDFSYDGVIKVIKKLNLSVQRGEHIAIVGGSGGGKSTIAKIIEGIYTPSAGTIKYYGISSCHINISEIRRVFSYVPQECTLFEGSIGDNIKLGNLNATQEMIYDAAKNAGIHDYIEKLPNRYETQVGECGGQLSGGQKQRIAIARAFLRDAEVFVFDEATSALDAETEREIQERIDAVCRNKTTITITHRINSVKNADRILVLESGKVIEEGNFKTLLEKNGNFSKLYRTQMSTKMFAKEEYPEIY